MPQPAKTPKAKPRSKHLPKRKVNYGERRCLRFPESLDHWLSDKADKQGITFSDVVRFSLLKLRDLELEEERTAEARRQAPDNLRVG